MSVVHQLSPGWLLDHLSFINNINYQLHQHHEPCLTSFGNSTTFIAFDSTSKPDYDDRGNSEVFIQKYVFRSELFNVTKPYITPAVHKECQQRNEKEDPMSGVKEENFNSIIGKVESFNKFLFFYRTHKRSLLFQYLKYLVIYYV